MNDTHLEIARQSYEKYGRLSATYLQRKLMISYTKALEIIAIVKEELINKRLLD